MKWLSKLELKHGCTSNRLNRSRRLVDLVYFQCSPLILRFPAKSALAELHFLQQFSHAFCKL